MAARFTCILLLFICLPVNSQQPDRALHAARLRADILERPEVDRLVPPTSMRDNSSLSSGTDVGLNLRIFKTKTVSSAEGLIQLKVWVRMQWSDARMAWNRSQYGGLSHVYFQGESYAGAETSEIWIPDITPYNGLYGLSQTTEPALIRVSHDGTVYHSRPGVLEILWCLLDVNPRHTDTSHFIPPTPCLLPPYLRLPTSYRSKFSGLVAFPFDDLICHMEFGGWMLSSIHQGITLLDGGVDLSSSEVTSGVSYQEFKIRYINVTLKEYSYGGFNNETWPAVVYRLVLRREGMFYTFASILPGISVTVLSFAVFFADTASADALGYGITVLVVNLLLNVVIATMLPVCGELIWLDLFSLVNTIFCFIALAQSTLNVMIESADSDYLLPEWVMFVGSAMARRLCCLTSAIIPQSIRSRLEIRPFSEGVSVSENPKHDPFTLLSSSGALGESVAGLLYRQYKNQRTENVIARAIQEPPRERKDLSDEEVASMLSYFEKLFFEVDCHDARIHTSAHACLHAYMPGRLPRCIGFHQYGGMRGAPFVHGSGHRTNGASPGLQEPRPQWQRPAQSGRILPALLQPPVERAVSKAGPCSRKSEECPLGSGTA